MLITLKFIEAHYFFQAKNLKKNWTYTCFAFCYVLVLVQLRRKEMFPFFLKCFLKIKLITVNLSSGIYSELISMFDGRWPPWAWIGDQGSRGSWWGQWGHVRFTARSRAGHVRSGRHLFPRLLRPSIGDIEAGEVMGRSSPREHGGYQLWEVI